MRSKTSKKKKVHKQTKKGNIFMRLTSKKKVVYSVVCFLCFLKASKRKKAAYIFVSS